MVDFMNGRRLRALPLLLAIGALGACAVTPPAGPMVLATPSQGKEPERFRQEDVYCREVASASIGGISPGIAANQSAAGSAAAGTALGAAAGALIGSASANAGAGAAIGAGAGLLLGSAIGAGNAQTSGVATQQAYDMSYAQCMTGQGNIVQAGVLPPVGPAPVAAVPYVEPYAVPVPVPSYGYYSPGWAYRGPSVSLGFGYYRGGWGRPWYYGRPYHGWYGRRW
jgi:hypothetical protein